MRLRGLSRADSFVGPKPVSTFSSYRFIGPGRLEPEPRCNSEVGSVLCYRIRAKYCAKVRVKAHYTSPREVYRGLRKKKNRVRLHEAC